MKFSDFVKMGSHTFGLLQNKDLQELFGMAKNGYKYYKEQQEKNRPKHVFVPIYIPHHYPTPIDSPHWTGSHLHGSHSPYGHFGRPPVGRLVSHRKPSRPQK
ncbi:hypothetical protein [Effusibacillus pohliae]|uniref:hypothetical protein n=1 Tax=Effusibacillus pohliae TaxID=232270 RepID=UPI000370668B|nr:hypothetical protein [Effusibacillus pohliae]